VGFEVLTMSCYYFSKFYLNSEYRRRP